MFAAITGDFRIVTPYDSGNGYKFNQYFISGLDGKILKVPKHIWFGINNLSNNTSTIIMARIGNASKFETLKNNIFDWHDKH
jgi:dTDP-4-dehydrorhamnose 3,5-epimerase-like enzyme